MRGKKVSPQDFIDRFLEVRNCDLVKILGHRKFRVVCRSCKTLRVLETTNSHLYGDCGSTKCLELKKSARAKKPWRWQRTPAEHTKEIRDAGFSDYSSICVGVQSRKNPTKGVYRHDVCGTRFEMGRGQFMRMKTERCPKCRGHSGAGHGAVYTKEMFLEVMKKFSKVIVPIGEFRSTTSEMRFRYVVCGHTTRMKPHVFTCHAKPVRRCKVCHKSTTWYKVRIGGRCFQTRSRIEYKFIKFLISKGIDVNRIEYEPSDSRITYFSPAANKHRKYVPDFRVGQMHLEVKDLASLGLKDYKWLPKEKALIENRAKYEAAVKKLGTNYRIYVHHNGDFLSRT